MVGTLYDSISESKFKHQGIELFAELDKRTRINEKSLRGKCCLIFLREGIEELSSQIANDATFESILSNVCIGNAVDEEAAWSGLKACNYFDVLLKRFGAGTVLFFSMPPKIALLQNVTRELVDWDGSQTPARQARKAMRIIKKLKVGENFSFLSGYSGIPSGHTMIMRIQRRTIQAYSFYVYDASGVDGFDSLAGKKVEHKTRVIPYYQWDNVTDQVLFFGSDDPLMFENLFSLLKETHERNRSKDMVMGYLAPLNTCPLNFTGKKRIMPQRGKNCPKKSLYCLYNHLIDYERDYKRFTLDASLATLVAGLEYLKQKDHQQPKHMLIMQEAFRGFKRHLNEAKEHKFIIDEECNESLATIQEMQRELDALTWLPKCTLAAAGTFDEDEFSRLACTESELRSSSFTSLPSPKPAKQQEVRTFFFQTSLGVDAMWKKLPGILYSCKASLKKAKDLRIKILQIEFLFWNLSHLKETVCVDLEIKKHQDVLIDLFNIAKSYNQAVYDMSWQSSPNVQNTLMEIYALAYIVAKNYDSSGILGQYGLYYGHYKALGEAPLFTAHTQQAVQQRNRLLHFFASLPKTQELFNLATGDFSSSEVENCRIPDTKILQQYFARNKQPLTNEKAANYFCSYDNFPDFLSHYCTLKNIANEVFDGFGLGEDRQSKESLLEAKEGNSNWTFQSTHRRWSDGNHQSLLKGLQNRLLLSYAPTNEKFLENETLISQSSAVYSIIRRENELISKSDPKALEGLWSFLAALAEPDVQTSLLVKAARERLSDFRRPEVRMLFETYFFKTEQKALASVSPLFDSLKNDPAFLMRMGKLMEDAFGFYASAAEGIGKNENRLALLFFIRLYAMAVNNKLEIDPATDLRMFVTLQTRLYKWLCKREDEVRHDQQLRKEFLLAKVLLLLPRLSNDSERADLIRSYFDLCKTVSPHDRLQSLAALRYCHEQWIIKCESWSELEDYQDIAKQVLQSIAPAIKINSAKLKDLQICVKCDYEKWRINLDECSIRGPSGEWTSTVPQLENFKSYERLFKDRQQETQTVGASIFFCDAVWKNIEIVEATGGEDIFRIRDGEKQLYIPSAEMEWLNNSSIIYDHAFWLGKSRIHVCDLKSGEERFHIDRRNGKICTKLNGEVLLNGLAATGVETLLTKFEHSGQMVLVKDENGCRIELPRFNFEGGPLTFHYDAEEKVWVYAKERRFYLVPPDCADFGMDRVLQLSSLDSSEKRVLIPKGNVRSKNFEPSSTIELPPPNLDGSRHAILRYEYTLEGSELSSTNNEHLMYLAHIHLAAKNYQGAKRCIDKIHAMESVTKSVWGILFGMIKNKESDASGTAAAIRLQALVRLYELDPLSPYLDLKNNPKQRKIILSLYKHYVDRLASVQHDFLLTLEQEKDLLELLPANSEVSTITRHSFKEQTYVTKWTAQNVFSRDFFLHVGANPKFQRFYDALQYHMSTFSQDIIPAKKFIENRSDAFNEAYQKLMSTENDRKELYRLITKPDPSLTELEREIITRMSVWKLNNSFRTIKPLPPHEKHEEVKVWAANFLKEHVVCKKDKEEHSRLTLNISKPKKKGWSEIALRPRFKKIHVQPWDTKKISDKGKLHYCDKEFLKLQDKYLTGKPAHKSFVEEKNLTVLPASAQLCKTAVEVRLDYYKSDRLHAFKTAGEEKSLIANKTKLTHLKEKLKASRDYSLEYERVLLASAVGIANKMPYGLAEFTQSQLKYQGAGRRSLTIDELCRAAARPNASRILSDLNPYLHLNELDTLQATVIDYMTEQTYRKHLENILYFLELYLKGDCRNDSLLDEASERMAIERAYIPHKGPFFLHFDYFSGLRMRKDQKKDIDKVLKAILDLNQGIAFQKPSGKGKTSVVISSLAELIAESGYLFSIASHYSQYLSMHNALPTLQIPRFAKRPVELSFSLKSLNDLDQLKLIKETLRKTIKTRSLLHWKATQPQLLRIKYQLLCRSLIRMSPANRLDLAQNIKTLAEINKLLKDREIRMLDEGDMQLSLATSVIVPIEEAKPLVPERSELIATVFLHLLDPEIKDSVKLLANRQNELTPHEISSVVLKHLAKKLCAFKPLLLFRKEALIAAFQRYICNEIPHEDQALADDHGIEIDKISTQNTKENVEFLRWAEAKYNSHNVHERNAADMIALCKHVGKILVITLGKKWNRRYGPNKEDNGAVIPFNGVRAPSPNNFGKVYAALCYSLQGSLGGGISSGELSFLADKMEEAAHYFAPRDKVEWYNTMEAQQFKKLTSLTLSEMKDSARVIKALAHLNDPSHPERRIALRQEVARFHVHYYPKIVECDPITVQKAPRKIVACSATWNWSVLDKKLKVAFDKGGEGAVLNTLLNREYGHDSEKGEFYPTVCLIDEQSLADVLKLVNEHPLKNETLGFIDAGGYMLDDTPQEMAANILAELPHLEAVVFSRQFSEEERADHPECSEEEFILLPRKGPWQVVKGSKRGDIEKHGVSLEKTCFLLDEQRSFGTDFEMAENAVFFLTCDPRMPLRTLLQALLRPRKYHKSNRIFLVMTKKAKEEILNRSSDLQDIKDTLIINEAVMGANETLPSYLKQCKNHITSLVFDELVSFGISGNLDLIAELSEKMEPIMVSTEEDQPWKQYGRIPKLERPAVIIKRYSEKLLSQLRQIERKWVPEVEAEFKSLVRLAEKDPCLPDWALEQEALANDNAEIQIEIETNFDVSREEGYVELNVETMAEHELYQIHTSGIPYIEGWPAINVSNNLVSWQEIVPQIELLTNVLQETYQNDFQEVSTKKYAGLFPSNIWITKNLRYCFNEKLPLLHSKNKQCHFVLVFKKNDSDEFQYIFASAKDGVIWKKMIREQNPQNVWIYGLDGYSESVSNRHPVRDKSFFDNLDKALCLANCFDGNIICLEQNEKLSQEIIGHNRALWGSFMMLKSASDQARLRAIYSSDLIDTNHENHVGIVLFSDRLKKIRDRYLMINGYTPAQIAVMEPEEVSNLSADKVKYLTNEKQIEALPDALFDHLEEEQVCLLTPARMHLLRKRKLIMAITCKEAVENMPPEQVPHLALRMRKHLTNVGQLLACPSSEGLSDDQIKLLTCHLNSIRNEIKASLPQPWLVAYLSVKNFGQWELSLKDIANIETTQLRLVYQPEIIRQLSVKQVKYLNDDNLQFINPEIVKDLPSKIVKRLTNPELLKLVPLKFIHYIKANLRALPQDIFEELIEYNPDFAEILLLEELLVWQTSLPLSCVQEVMLNSFFCREEKFDKMYPWHVKYVPPEVIPKLLKQRPDLSDEVSCEKLCMLDIDPGLSRGLADKFRGYLKANPYQNVKPWMVAYSDFKNILKNHTLMAKSFTDDQWIQVKNDPSDLIFLEDDMLPLVKDLVPKMHIYSLYALIRKDERFIHYLSLDQLLIFQADWAGKEHPTFHLKLAEHQRKAFIKYLTEFDWKPEDLRAWHVPLIPLNLLNKTIDVYHLWINVQEHQIRKLTYANHKPIIRKLSGYQIQFLTKTALQAICEKQVERLGGRYVELTKRKLIVHVPFYAIKDVERTIQQWPAAKAKKLIEQDAKFCQCLLVKQFLHLDKEIVLTDSQKKDLRDYCHYARNAYRIPLKPWHIPYLEVPFILAKRPDMLFYLSDEQIKNSKELSAVYKLFTTKQFDYVSEDALNEIDPIFIHKLSNEALGKLKAVQLLAVVPIEKRYLVKENVQKLDETHVNKLLALNSSYLRELSVEQFMRFPEGIELSPEQTLEFMAYLGAGKWKPSELKPWHVVYIPVHCLNKITHVPALRDHIKIKQLNELTEKQQLLIHHLNQWQISHLNDDALQLIRKTQVSTLYDETLARLRNMNLIVEVSAERVLTVKEHIQTLSYDEVKVLVAEHPKFVLCLSPAQLLQFEQNPGLQSEQKAELINHVEEEKGKKDTLYSWISQLNPFK